MIVKIFEPVKGFPGVGYNLTKIERGKAELMKLANFGALEGYSQLSARDLNDYFHQLAALNRRTIYPMLHGTISAAGRTSTKEELTEAAERWLAVMGYGDQPYLIVFHKDTANNHVHMVTSRIDRNGIKISSAYEHKRAISALNKAIGLDENLAARKDLQDALNYRFATLAQFTMVLEARGYRVHQNGLVKYGKRLQDIPPVEFKPPSRQRAQQLKAIVEKYRHEYSAKLVPSTATLPSGFEKPLHQFRSDLADYLRARHGLELVFHASGDKPPYGYSVIDHAKKNVFKGSEVMLLKALLEPVETATKKLEASPLTAKVLDDKPLVDYYQSLLKAAENYPTLEEGLDSLGLDTDSGFLLDRSANIAVPVSAFDAPIRISIADDVDDQQIHGMRRRRQKKARTNTR